VKLLVLLAPPLGLELCVALPPELCVELLPELWEEPLPVLSLPPELKLWLPELKLWLPPELCEE